MSLHSEPLDVLDAGPGEPHPGRRKAVVVLVVLLALVAAGVWYADRRSQDSEHRALTECAERADHEVQQATAQIARLAEFIRPSLAFESSTMSGDRLYAMLAVEAEKAGDGLGTATQRCTAIPVRGWHELQEAAKASWLVYLSAVSDLVEDTAVDGRAFFADYDRLETLRSRAAADLAVAD